MAKPPPHRVPDPMAGVVDRLLAQLPGLQGQPETPRSNFSRPPLQQPGVSSPLIRAPVADYSHVIGAWVRVLLALALGVMMAGWPYLSACGLPLMGYLGAVGVVIWAGGWAAVATWRYRAALAHVVSLILILYGVTLALAEVLPRTGYAIPRATWQCEESTSSGIITAHHPTETIQTRS